MTSPKCIELDTACMKRCNLKIFKIIHPFPTNFPRLYPLKTSENLRFSDVFRGHRRETLVENGLITTLEQ